MSEDAHDSNINPYTGEPRWFGKAMEKALNINVPTVPCTECGEPVYPDEVYLVEVTHLEGPSEIAVFHKDFAKSCPLKWAVKRLKAANERMQQILDGRRS